MYETIISVAVEEMLHLILAGNLLVSQGGKPRVYSEEMMPTYPFDLPHVDRGGKRGKILLTLEKASVEHFKNVFIPVEMFNLHTPNKKLEEEEEYASIGDFYHHVLESWKTLDGEGVLTYKNQELQFPPGLGFIEQSGRGGIIDICDFDDAKLAINTIIEQGEGYNPPIDLDYASERSHLKKWIDLSESFIPLDETDDHKWGVYPVMDNPTQKILDEEGGDIKTLGRLFNATYAYILQTIDAAFRTKDIKVKEQMVYGGLFNMMGGVLTPVARKLVTLPMKKVPGCNAGPTFEFYKFQKGFSQRQQIIELINEWKERNPKDTTLDNAIEKIGLLPDITHVGEWPDEITADTFPSEDQIPSGNRILVTKTQHKK